ncbi:MAG: bifunctional phosphoribosyl-AMP cyclohydrolase/phosphoribosyl-ATP diphosphatase HisIE [Eubacteriales bacterium]|nr:bifunctional phosphoribosyl-AMP cyclohydrolase/phosphoribosyl-ATP diphosphatase HisIE [Eubacteriales bacterium]
MDFDKIKFDEKGLVPVIVQDIKTNAVLMLAYMNRESIEKTIETNNMVYFSRSRQKLWLKGETSGNFQTLHELKIDCDGDTLLALVSQKGVACHTGSYSCFFESLQGDSQYAYGYGIIDELYGVIQDRKANPKEGSYTNYLFDKGIDKILKKIGEEAAEIIIAAKNDAPDEIRYECADLMYHLLVMLCERGLSPSEIFTELEKRRQ